MTFVGRQVLVVEDDYLVSLATTDLLQCLGCVVVGPAVSLATALRFARSESLDGGILDIDLAGEKVWPVADELHRRKIPFLFLSAYRPPDGAPAHISAAPHVEKPLEPIYLRRVLGDLWRP